MKTKIESECALRGRCDSHPNNNINKQLLSAALSGDLEAAIVALQNGADADSEADARQIFLSDIGAELGIAALLIAQKRQKIAKRRTK